MNTQQIRNTFKNVQRTTGNLGLWLGLGILLFVAALAINGISRRAMIVPNTGAPAAAVNSNPSAQTVPEAGVQGVNDYILAHSNLSTQAVPEAGVQSVTDYIRVHSDSSVQVVPEASVQSVTNYIGLHSNDLSTTPITDPAVQSVMDYLKAHCIQP